MFDNVWVMFPSGNVSIRLSVQIRYTNLFPLSLKGLYSNQTKLFLFFSYLFCFQHYSHGQSNVVKELLQNGATLQCNLDNQTPLFVALRVNKLYLCFHDYFSTINVENILKNNMFL